MKLLIEPVKVLKELVVTSPDMSVSTPVKPLPSPKNEPENEPLLYEPVKALKELVVVNDPVWLFETYEEVADVKVSTSNCMLEVNVFIELVKLLNELVVTSPDMSVPTPVKPLPSPKNEPENDPLLYEPVKLLNEPVVVNDPVWLFETYEDVWEVKLSTSDCILEVNELKELVVVNDPVWLFETYEPVWDVKLSTSDWILEVNVLIELVKLLNELVVTNPDISVPTPVKPLPSPWKDPLNEPLTPWVILTEPENIAGPILVNVDEPDTVKDPVITWLPIKLFEPVVAKEPVWEFKTYEPVWDVRLSTSVCILEVNELNELVVTNEPVGNVPEGPAGPVMPGVATCITLVTGCDILTAQPSGLTTVILLLSGWMLTVLTSEFIFIELLQDAILIGNLLR